MNFLAQLSLLIRSLEFFFHFHLLTGLVTFIGVAIPLRKHLARYRHRSASAERIPFECFNAPEVSILIPVFNEGRHIVRGVNAALASDYPNHRVVVINDGSTDITMALLDSDRQAPLGQGGYAQCGSGHGHVASGVLHGCGLDHHARGTRKAYVAFH
jgi:hypothetical protein